MKRFIALALLTASVAHAATFTATGTQTPWGLYAGSGTGKLLASYPTFDACVQAAAATAAKAGAATCKPPASNVTIVAAPTCPAKPADETQSAQCPSGTVGSWTQTRSYSSTAAPTCWTAGAWSPAAAPAGACTTPASGYTWTKIGDEDDATTLTVPAGSTVRYGIRTSWIEKTISGSTFICWNGYFGGDPLVGMRKQCELRSGGAQPPSTTGSASVSWAAPTSNADGTPLLDLAGYRVLWGTASGVYTQSLTTSATTATVPNLAAGKWFFVVKAIDTSGNESAPSIEASKTIQ